MAEPAPIGARVRFAPSPRFPDREIEATVVGHRAAFHYAWARPNAQPRQVFLETVDDAGFERSVLPSRATIVAPETVDG